MNKFGKLLLLTFKEMLELLDASKVMMFLTRRYWEVLIRFR